MIFLAFRQVIKNFKFPARSFDVVLHRDPSKHDILGPVGIMQGLCMKFWLATTRACVTHRSWLLILSYPGTFCVHAQPCRAVPPRPCLGSIAVHDIRCTAVTPFIKDCLTEAILIPLVHHAAEVPLDTKRMIMFIIPWRAPMTYMVPLGTLP
jgi:hypothetical protein